MHLIEEVIGWGQELLQKPVTLLEGVKETISSLHGKYKLVLATKGDLFDQKRKIEASGLREYFHHITSSIRCIFPFPSVTLQMVSVILSIMLFSP